MNKDSIYSKVKLFLSQNVDRKKPLLLAFSGGVDSRVLLDLLLKYQKENFFELHLAHVDHRLRLTSQAEAERLKKEAFEKKLIFHLHTLSGLKGSKNLEERCREKRYAFLASLVQQYDFQAVVVAHHADDLAETVLKRIFEGAHFTALKGIEPKIMLKKGLILWRPLLEISKKEIQKYAETKQLEVIQDETNFSLEFLRGKMRQKIFPFLEKSFGKNIRENLCLLGKRALEVKEYLDQKIAPALSFVESGHFGLFLPWDQATANFLKLEKEHLLRYLANRIGFTLKRVELEAILSLLKQKKNGKQIIVEKENIIQVEYPYLFYTQRIEVEKMDRVACKMGTQQIGIWKITLEKVQETRKEVKRGWRNFFLENRSSIWLGKKPKYFFNDFSKNLVSEQKKICERYRQAKIPTFLRPILPYVTDREGRFYDFLTSNNSESIVNKGYLVSIELLKI